MEWGVQRLFTSCHLSTTNKGTNFLEACNLIPGRAAQVELKRGSCLYVISISLFIANFCSYLGLLTGVTPPLDRGLVVGGQNTMALVAPTAGITAISASPSPSSLPRSFFFFSFFPRPDQPANPQNATPSTVITAGTTAWPTQPRQAPGPRAPRPRRTRRRPQRRPRPLGRGPRTRQSRPTGRRRRRERMAARRVMVVVVVEVTTLRHSSRQQLSSMPTSKVNPWRLSGFK